MKLYTVPILLSIPLAFAQGQKNKQPVEQLDALVVESTALDSKLSDVTQSAVVLFGKSVEHGFTSFQGLSVELLPEGIAQLEPAKKPAGGENFLYWARGPPIEV